jgi:dephospho-CoA kinase
MRILGLTGSIGMGKSTTAGFFRQRGVPVFDADACVHRLYEGEMVPALSQAFPEAVTTAGKVDRAALRDAVIGRPERIAALEQIIHPAVRRNKWDFVAAQARAGAAVSVLDIPLLFEIGDDRRVDAVVVVTAPPEVQKARILARASAYSAENASKQESMSAAQAEAILGRQTPDAEKRARAHFIVETQHGLAHARRRVGVIMRALAV